MVIIGLVVNIYEVKSSISISAGVKWCMQVGLIGVYN
jgi:hypothetical protein